jgi:hypothetical protein
MMHSLNRRFTFFLLAILLCSQSAIAQKIDRYMKFAHPLGSGKLTFPGGKTLVEFPVETYTNEVDTTQKLRKFLVDLGVSIEGHYVALEGMPSDEPQAFNLRLSPARMVHMTLVPSATHRAIYEYDSTFLGVLGYGLFKQFTTVFDFKRGTLTLYPLFANIDVSDRDTSAIIIPSFDDAVLTYCHCPFPTVWLEAEAPPLKKGRVHLAFQEQQSRVFLPSLDSKSKKLWDECEVDPVTNKKKKLGFSLAQFKLAGQNIAPNNPRRTVEELPPLFRDLSVPIMGTMATDVLRTFSAIVIDPARSRVILVK